MESLGCRAVQRIIASLALVAVLAVVLGAAVKDELGGGDEAPRGALASSANAPTHGCDHADEVPSAGDGERVERATLCLLNAERRAHDRSTLAPDRRLERAARAHARDMLARDFVEHVTPDGVTPDERIRAAGYDGPGFTGENLAYGELEVSTPAAIVDGWMHSPGHRANILRRAFTEIGVAIEPRAIGSDRPGGTYVTTFGGPPR